MPLPNSLIEGDAILRSQNNTNDNYQASPLPWCNPLDQEAITRAIL
ncbi:hypothetical protein [Acaryochloris marina]|uniref:Uncharacterized protein n=1 Tax=Acaryochloris marina (strain MBIC 11017) TaxID=329726 RepID=A8ZL28_ACAM1|nr:hypothetical protein [Acaryochloris marina]ABW31496.1 hypothetical protein AM1_A0378 [Acaryochloris marina MBIC11017]